MIKSDNTSYGTVAVSIHWLSAVLIIALAGSGFRAAGMVDPVTKAGILQLHVPLGLLILTLTLVRIAWWLFADKKPSPAPMPAWQQRSSSAVHIAFYIVILGMAASGIGMLVLSGAGPQIFGDGTGLPDFHNYRPRKPHGIGARLMVLLFLAHVGAALYHHFIKRDGLMARMWLKRHK